MKKDSLLNEKNLKVVFILSGVFFLVYGIILCIFSNINTGVVLVGLIGVFLLCLGAFYNKIKKLTSYGIFKKIKIFVIVLMIFEMSLILFIAFFGYSDNARYNEEAVIVLGAGIRGDKVTYPLKMRLDKAIEYHKKNPEALIVLSGGQGFQETVTEAYAMEKYLVNNGVDKNKIIKEEKATSTYENMTFSKKILDEILENEYSVVVITNNFHILRATSVAKNAGFFDVTHIHAELQWYNLLPCFLRESLAVLKMLFKY